MQYIAAGVTAQHGPMTTTAVNVQVSIAGMDVLPGEVIHMDEDGACKFPADQLEAICANIDGFSKAEAKQSQELLCAKTPGDIKAVWSNSMYAQVSAMYGR